MMVVKWELKFQLSCILSNGKTVSSTVVKNLNMFKLQNDSSMIVVDKSACSSASFQG